MSKPVVKKCEPCTAENCIPFDKRKLCVKCNAWTQNNMAPGEGLRLNAEQIRNVAERLPEYLQASFLALADSLQAGDDTALVELPWPEVIQQQLEAV